MTTKYLGVAKKYQTHHLVYTRRKWPVERCLPVYTVTVTKNIQEADWHDTEQAALDQADKLESEQKAANAYYRKTSDKTGEYKSCEPTIMVLKVLPRIYEQNDLDDMHARLERQQEQDEALRYSG